MDWFEFTKDCPIITQCIKEDEEMSNNKEGRRTATMADLKNGVDLRLKIEPGKKNNVYRYSNTEIKKFRRRKGDWLSVSIKPDPKLFYVKDK